MLGKGGEAWVYGVPTEPGLAAKIYRHISQEQVRKLAAMIANPPRDPMAAKRHVSIAWPIDILRNAEGNQVVGFLMPRARGARPISDVFGPRNRRQVYPHFNYRHLIYTARNLASTIHAVHDGGCVLGDLKDSNVLVSEAAVVTLVDTDSFQVRDNKHVFRCQVGTPE